MRVMLWCDMEGVAGISVWEQVNGGAALYEEGRRLYTAEVNAAVRGAKRAGATEIVVAICGAFDCPCVFVSGDAATCTEVKALLGEEVVAAPVKVGLTRFSAKHLAATEACEKIEAGVLESLTERNWPKPLKFAAPV